MTINFSVPRQDRALLKTPAILLAIAALCGAFLTAGPIYFRNSQHSALQTARTDRETRATVLQQVEDEKKTIERNINQYRKIEAELIGEENRLALIEAVNQTRERHKLFPVQIEIEPQRPAIEKPKVPGLESTPADAATGLNMKASRIKITLPLLHEEDLGIFLNELKQHIGLFVVEACSIRRTGSTLTAGKAELTENLSASCQVLWLTFQPAATSTAQRPGERS